MENLNLKIFDRYKLLNYLNSNLKKDSESLSFGLEIVTDTYDKANIESRLLRGSHRVYTITTPLIRNLNSKIGEIFVEVGVLSKLEYDVAADFGKRFIMENSYYELLILDTNKSISFNNKKVLPPSSILLTIPYSYPIDQIYRVDKKKHFWSFESNSELHFYCEAIGLLSAYKNFNDIIPTNNFISDDYDERSLLFKSKIISNWEKSIVPLEYLRPSLILPFYV